MQWVPDTIDAITRLYKEAGLGGLLVVIIAVAIFMMVITFSLVLIRYTSQIVQLGRDWVAVQREVGNKLGGILNDQTGVLQQQNNKIDATNAKLDKIASDSATQTNQLKEMVDAFGSDPMRMCKLNDAADRFREAMKAKGVEVSAEEALSLITRARNTGTASPTKG